MVLPGIAPMMHKPPAAGGGGGFVCDAAQFIGSGLSGGGTGMRTGTSNRITTDTRFMTLSFWWMPGAGAGTNRALLMLGGGFGSIAIGTDNKLSVVLNDSGGTKVSYKNATAMNSSIWYHVFTGFDVDAATPKQRTYINGIDDTATATTLTRLTSTNIDWSRPQTGLWSNNASGDTDGFDGGQAEFWFDNSAFLDPDTPANLAKFISGGKPVYLGDNGEIPLTATPQIYRHLDDGESAENYRDIEYGTISNSWTQHNGPVLTASTSPSD